jgi:hypothetical protein
MRAHEFLIEYDPNLPDDQLKKQVIGMVKGADRELLDKVYQTLSSGDFDTRIEAAISQDGDAAMIKDRLTQIIVSTKGTYTDKTQFLENFNKGFINTKNLLSPESSVDQFFVGSAFAKTVFLTTARTVISQGVGPGEYALAAFSPNIKFAGRSRGAGDLIIVGKTSVELKGKVKSWGRLIDARKMKFNMDAIRQAFSQAGIEQDTLTVKQWLGMRANLNPKVVTNLSKITVSNTFKFIAPNGAANLVKALATGSSEQIKQIWGALSFENYKGASGFDGILFFDTNSGTTRYVSSAEEISTMAVDSPQMYGPEQGAMPKVGF